MSTADAWGQVEGSARQQPGSAEAALARGGQEELLQWCSIREGGGERGDARGGELERGRVGGQGLRAPPSTVLGDRLRPSKATQAVQMQMQMQMQMHLHAVQSTDSS